ncbi:MAG: hypothetical protein ABIG94_13510 [Pseudomonadota bacterium]
MAQFSRLLITLALGVALAGSPALAQEIRINPVPPHVKPQWTPVPGAPQVYYAPNLPTDVFRYRGKYYFFWAGYLYQGKKPSGPWKTVKEVPAFFHEIDAAYFKTVKKEGGAPTPPATAAPPEAAPGAPGSETPQVESAPAAPPETAAPASPEPTQEAPAPQETAPEDAPKPPKVM